MRTLKSLMEILRGAVNGRSRSFTDDENGAAGITGPDGLFG